MSEFKREVRYTVIKHNQLTESQMQYLKKCIFGEGIPTVEAVVVESDWPEYQPVWKMIEDRVSGAPVEGGKAEYDALAQSMTTNQTIDGVRRELLEAAVLCMECADYLPPAWTKELRALLDAPADTRAATVPKHKFDTLVQHCKRLDGEIAQAHAHVNEITLYQQNAVWFWQHDGEDFLESLSCPIIIQPHHLRELLKGVVPAEQPAPIAVEYKLHMGDAIRVFEALKVGRLSRRVERADLGPMGATEIETWSTAIGVTLEMHTAMGRCTLIVRTAPASTS